MYIWYRIEYNAAFPWKKVFCIAAHRIDPSDGFWPGRVGGWGRNNIFCFARFECRCLGSLPAGIVTLEFENRQITFNKQCHDLPFFLNSEGGIEEAQSFVMCFCLCEVTLCCCQDVFQLHFHLFSWDSPSRRMHSFSIVGDGRTMLNANCWPSYLLTLQYIWTQNVRMMDTGETHSATTSLWCPRGFYSLG